LEDQLSSLKNPMTQADQDLIAATLVFFFKLGNDRP
jgi:hypothetical protein